MAVSLANLSANATSLQLSIDALAGNVSVSGNLSAGGYILGNGSLLTGLATPLAVSNVRVSDNAGVVQTELAVDTTGGGYVVINGSGFTNTPATVLFGNIAALGFGMNSATSSTYISSSKYLCQVPALASGTYAAWMYHNNAVAVLQNALKYSIPASWTTAALLANVVKNVAFSRTLVATSDSTITYGNTSALPTGVTLNASTGVLTGNITANIAGTDTYGFTIQAIDLELQKSLRTFSLTATMSILVASGGTVTTSGNYRIHTFTSSGTFTVTANGGSVEYLVIAGGGGGGVTAGGGGGAGGVLFGTMTSAVQAYSVTVGALGAGGVNSGAVPAVSGSPSVFSAFTAVGGGGGGSMDYLVSAVSGRGKDGGSGGGGTRATGTPGTGTAGQGNDGGLGINGDGTTALGSGGGSYTAAGGGSLAATRGGNGAAGYTSSISGAAVTYAGGGGGGSGSTYVGGTGGTGGGGNGSKSTTVGVAATGYGSGGGGGGASSGNGANGGAGSAGIVVLRYIYQ